MKTKQIQCTPNTSATIFLLWDLVGKENVHDGGRETAPTAFVSEEDLPTVESLLKEKGIRIRILN
jgi:hypothetical protein